MTHASTESTMFQILALTLVALSSTRVSASPAPGTLLTLVNPVGTPTVPITISGSILGVDAEGRTTYAFTDAATTAIAQKTIAGTERVTVVAASDYFSITDEISVDGVTIAVGAECEVGNANAVCTVAGPKVTTVVTETAMGTLVLDIPSPTDKPISAADGLRTNNFGHFGAGVGLLLAWQLL
ncbi:hypothetical protein MSAN_01905500 [Mycena sanguinolenta]|uniref:Uncharacterized protein n=1 Tax=Mycena sanguinolenta TaxID=230812 RepID=A0A8H6XNZ8_9AGAR|nr:hypothetical protein MSAN_01905500 [Mycena sanguinolenta]